MFFRTHLLKPVSEFNLSVQVTNKHSPGTSYPNPLNTNINEATYLASRGDGYVVVHLKTTAVYFGPKRNS